MRQKNSSEKMAPRRTQQDGTHTLRSGRNAVPLRRALAIAAAAIAVLLIGIAAFVLASGKFRQYRVAIPTYNQYEYGYPKGCEGVSLYMAMKGRGYLEEVSLDDFMADMPRSDSDPELGYVGNPSETKASAANEGKRTTINPGPLAKWAAKYGNVASLQGAEVSELKAELRKGNPLVVYVTVNWAEPKWGTWDWGDAVTNNHAVCLVGYRADTEAYLINDCGMHTGEYWVDQDTFEEIYNARKFAVVVR